MLVSLHDQKFGAKNCKTNCKLSFFLTVNASQLLLFINRATGSRGDVFVVRTSKPVEIMGYFDRVDDRVTVSLQILYTTNQETRGY